MTVINQNSISGITSITAASGSVQIFNSDGSSGSLTNLSGVNVSGVVTATSFVGSGANLTGIAATDRINTQSISVSGITTVSAGSTSAPSITPVGDTNTGIFFPSADTIAFGEGGTEAARIDSSGRFGLGTTSPGTKFHVIGGTTAGSVDTAAIFTGGSGTVGSGARIYLSGTPGFETTRGAYIEGVHEASTNAHGLRFATNATTADPVERMRITSGGFLKARGDETTYYGATASYHELRAGTGGSETVWITHTAGSPKGVFIKYTNAAPNSTGSEFLYCEDNAAQRAVIRSNGGLANYSGNNVNLSDINSKKDITPAAGTWDCIKEWEIVNYRYKDQPEDADLNLGVIAQQVAESCPEVITVFQEATEDQPEKLGVKEQQMYWMAIKALQEAQQRIEQLEARLTDAGIA